MERRSFIRSVGLACLGGAAIGTSLTVCATTRYVDGKLEGEDLQVPLLAFATKEGAPPLRHIVVRHESLRWPVAVYRQDETAYRALLMRCTHQNAQLKAGETELTCPAHGSAFLANGQVSNGPAAQPLRSFPVRVVGDQLLISLKA